MKKALKFIFVAALVVPKLYPLSKVPDTYFTDEPQREEIPEGKSIIDIFFAAFKLRIAAEKLFKNIFYRFFHFKFSPCRN